MKLPIKVIDLFAGPGGLGEGFSSNTSHFEIAISIEKDINAHRTLLLRAFYRKFKKTPDEYYQFLRGELGDTPEEQLYKFPKFKKELAKAQSEALRLTLGEDNEKIYDCIRNKIGLNEDCILIGGPPCQAYSVAGKARNLNNNDYNAEDDKRNFLYIEYLKVIAKFQPKLFVMENVKGMLSAKVNGESIINRILKDLKDPCLAVKTEPESGRQTYKYKIVSLAIPSADSIEGDKRNPKDFIVCCERYGIPQRRHRVILLGIRDDISSSKNYTSLLTQSLNPITTKDVIDDLPRLRSGLSKSVNTTEKWLETLLSMDMKIIKELESQGMHSVCRYIESAKLSLKKISNEQGKLLGLEKSKKLKIKKSKELEDWYIDPKLGNFITNHESRKHIPKDLYRYFFSSSWAAVAETKNWEIKFPKSAQYPTSLKPEHKNFDSGKFSDRFRVQLANIPATTITSHISKDGHYYIHYDTLQCRSLTVREAARIQTFPDNYFFVGDRTSQYVQVGNAVPPFLAKKIADNVYKILTNR